MKALGEFLIYTYQVILFVGALAFGLFLSDGDLVIALIALLPFWFVTFIFGNVALVFVVTAFEIIVDVSKSLFKF